MAGKVTTIHSARRRKTTRDRHALQFLVALTRTNPLVWRRIQVPDAYSFWDLHVAIQDAMGWQDYHLHEFRVVHPQRGKVEHLGIPDLDLPDERPCTASWDVPVSAYFNWESISQAQAAVYVYDFGDNWRHIVMFEDVLPVGSARLPRCVAGARACPPEDCGGVHGFDKFLEAIADLKHPEHADLVQWSGGGYNPEAFDPARVVFDNPHERWRKAFQE
ncbi:MAG: plasmid pRiA4b ORF-3 family protein [Nitrospirota bacterium]